MLINKAFTFRQMPSGRHAFALALMATAARDAGLPNTAARADRAVAQAHVALELEQMWLSVRANKSKARGNSKEIDKQLDEQVSALEQRLKAEARGEATDPAVKMARELLEQLFPEGLRGVTQGLRSPTGPGRHHPQTPGRRIFGAHASPQPGTPDRAHAFSQ